MVGSRGKDVVRLTARLGEVKYSRPFQNHAGTTQRLHYAQLLGKVPLGSLGAGKQGQRVREKLACTNYAMSMSMRSPWYGFLK